MVVLFEVSTNVAWAISMLNLDTVTVMSGFLYPYQLKGIDSQDLDKSFKLEQVSRECFL